MGTWQEFIPWNASAPVAAGAKARVIIISALSGIVLVKCYIRTELLLFVVILQEEKGEENYEEKEQ